MELHQTKKLLNSKRMNKMNNLLIGKKVVTNHIPDRGKYPKHMKNSYYSIAKKIILLKMSEGPA